MNKSVGAQGLVQRILDAAEQNQKPAIDVGEVKAYEKQEHLATLKYGQTPLPGDTAPSVGVKVDDDTLLYSKPIASPFAWHHCGLIVPVYPGMRALLAHNLGLVNDAVVAGFLWPEQPTYNRPKNEPGDYWLCLPTSLGPDGPTGKGVNDLSDMSGRRVIQAKGLHIFVGDSKLPEVGERPAVGKEQTIVIEHEQGATITFDSNGALEIKVTGSNEINIKNDTSSIKMSGSGVEVKAAKISLSSDSIVEIKAAQAKSG